MAKTEAANTGRILIVEPPEASAEDGLVAALNGAGHALAVCPDPVKALALLAEKEFDLVLLDLGFGQAAALPLLTQLRQGGEEGTGPSFILIMPAAGGGWFSETEVEHGTVFGRPFGRNELLARVRYQLRVDRLRRQLAARTLELERLSSRLERMLEMKSRFLSLTAHDIRTPINTIKLVADVLGGQFADDERESVRGPLDILARNVAKIEGKLDEFMLISRLDVEDIELAAGTADLNGIVQGATATFFPGAISRGIDLDAKFSPVPPLRLDGRRVGQLAQNLVANALGRSEKGGRLLVATGYDARRRAAWIAVTDYGPGFSGEEAEEILRGLAELRPTDGTRASLYAVYEIARRHGGELEIATVDGATTFTAWLAGIAPETGQ